MAASASVARFAAVVLTVGVGANVLAVDALLLATGVADVKRLLLNAPCVVVEILTVVVAVRLVVLARRTWRSCANIVA